MEPKASATIFRNIAIYSIYLAVFLMPLFYLPITVDPLFAKQILVILLSGLALLAWLVAILITKQIKFRVGTVSFAIIAFLTVIFFSSIFAINRHVSFFGPDPSGERFFSMASFMVISVILANVFTRKEIVLLLRILFSSAILYSLIIVLQMLPWFTLPEYLRVNPGGTLYGSSLLSAAIFLGALCFLLFRRDEASHKILDSILAWILIAVSALSLILIDSNIVWIGLAASAILLAAFCAAKFSLNTKAGAILLALIAASIIFAVTSFNPTYLIPGLKTELGVAPSFTSTLAIGIETLKSRPIIGTGPGTFIYDYGQLKSPVVNQTVFWNLRFNNGFSFATTAIATTGIFGFLALLFMAFGACLTIWEALKLGAERTSYVFSFSAISIFGIAMWFIFPSTFSMNGMIFVALGCLVAVCVPSDAASSKLAWRGISEYILKIDTQLWAFVMSLLTTSIFILVVLGSFFIVQRYIAAVNYNRGIFAFNQYGNVNTALVRFTEALALDSNNAAYHLSKSQLYLVEARYYIDRVASGNAEAQDAFRNNLNLAVESGRVATDLNPHDVSGWINLGNIYEAALPVVDGADGLAITAYENAHEREPANPIPLTFIGRTFITLADLLDLRLQRGLIPAKDARPLTEAALSRGKEYLERAVQVKSDYASAQFMLAQILSRQGNVDDAIRLGAQAALAAPQDVGVAFFLGFLLYQKNLLPEAEDEFSRAIRVNPNYSNARYFLGLIYDRTKRKGEALKQFRAISELNPENEEVKKIILNLESGREALAAVPPPPPEKRREPPVKDRVSR